MSSLASFATVLTLLIAILRLLDRFVEPTAKRALAQYLNPDLRSPSEAPSEHLIPPYDTATRVQAQIFDARFFSARFFIRSALITALFALTIGIFDAIRSPLFRLSLQNSFDVKSSQFAFLACVLLGVFVADYLCAGQTRFLLSLVRPTSRAGSP
jgi:hypothetical protein